jgi:hypothetical protein
MCHSGRQIKTQKKGGVGAFDDWSFAEHPRAASLDYAVFATARI